MSDIGCQMSDVKCQTLDVRYQMSDAKFRMLADTEESQDFRSPMPFLCEQYADDFDNNCIEALEHKLRPPNDKKAV